MVEGGRLKARVGQTLVVVQKHVETHGRACAMPSMSCVSITFPKRCACKSFS